MLYIMRHGRTDWNDRRKLQGRTDIPLNDAGREMAEAARKEYAGVAYRGSRSRIILQSVFIRIHPFL